MNKTTTPSPSAWRWVPTLYFTEGLPYVAVNTLSVVLYTDLGVPNGKMALFTSLLYLPWVLKFLWSPFVDVLRTKRWWIVSMQWLMALTLALVAVAVPTTWYFAATLAVFYITAFASATHDVAADGFYMLALDSNRQSLFVGIRSTFYRFATIFGQGVLVAMAGWLETATGNKPSAWAVVIFLAAAILGCMALWHTFALPRPAKDGTADDAKSAREIWRDFGRTFATFFAKKGIWIGIAFLLLYRLPEALMLKLVYPFLMGDPSTGGLGLTKAEVGTAYGIFGVAGLLVGGIVGGIVASRGGLKKWIRPMAWSMSLTCLTFLLLTYLADPSIFTVTACIVVEQFGYGFGFSAYMLYMLYISRGEFATSHYAFCTAFMAASMMVPGMFAGWIQEAVGYQNFFWICIVCCIATVTMASVVKVDPRFGKK